MFLLLALLLAAAAAPLEGQQSNAPTTLLLVRHAEAGGGDDPRDPPLTPAGRARAGSLAETLRDAGITAVVSTQYRRTRETGGAVAEALGLTPTVFEVGGTEVEQYSRALLDHVLAQHAGGTVLLVGHSNTTPIVVAAATGLPADTIAETEFDRLYVVTLGDGTPRVVRARYPPAHH